MARILGVDIPNNKRMVVALTYIYGVGKKTSKDILRDLQISEDKRAKDLNDEELSKIASHIQNNYIIEGQLHRQIRQNIQRLREIKSYVGLRHRHSLPVRGQRTRSNARTRKGPKKTVAGKKRVGKH